MKGIKTSKSIVFDIKYETYPDSGESEIWNDDEDFYIVGVGTDYLASAYHDGVTPEETDIELPVYLEDENKENTPTWNKDLIDGVFSNPITKVSENECEDLLLKAKWTQYIYKGSNTYKETNQDQSLIGIHSGDLLFKWKEN